MKRDILSRSEAPQYEGWWDVGSKSLSGSKTSPTPPSLPRMAAYRLLSHVYPTFYMVVEGRVQHELNFAY